MRAEPSGHTGGDVQGGSLSEVQPAGVTQQQQGQSQAAAPAAPAPAGAAAATAGAAGGNPSMQLEHSVEKRLDVAADVAWRLWMDLERAPQW